jgi:fructosamine-3-kinase
LESVSPTPETWHSLGEGLARLHLAPPVVSNYGAATDNFLGLAPQKNTPDQSWPEFYRQSRLHAMRDFIRSIGRWTVSWDVKFDRLCADLANRLPAKPKLSLVHGDLWTGNVLHLADGKAALIDPAIYVGHAEVDLAFSRLFGGFDSMFYESYYSLIPREPGYQERQDIYQLYHLIMHLAVSPGYGKGVQRMLDKLAG